MAESTSGAPDDFSRFWRDADDITGWLTEAQARLLWREASRLAPGATVLEIGSHKGRSTVVLAATVQQTAGTVIAIDPFVDGRLFGGKATQAEFEANLVKAGVRDAVRHVAEYSTRARPSWSSPIDMLYIDGKHDYWTLSDDLRWAEYLPRGGHVLIHDCFSSIGVTAGVLVHVLPSRRLTYLSRIGSMALFEVARPTMADRGRILAEMPWWFRNVFIKVLLRLRLRAVARLFGHASPYDPY